MNFKYTPYSFSKIGTFLQCPKKFDYGYIQKIKTEWKDSVALDRGKLIHLIFEFNKDIEKIKKHEDFIGVKKRNLLGKEGIKECFQTYDKFTKSKAGQTLLSKHQVFAEMPLGLDHDLEIMEYNPKNQKLNDLFLRGYIDAAFVKEGKTEDDEDVLVLVDWKTGKYKTKEYQTWDQLLWYSLGLFSKMPFNKIVLCYAYVDHEKLNLLEVNRSEIEKYKTALYNTVDKIETCQNFEKQETPLCGWCDYEDLCREETAKGLI